MERFDCTITIPLVTAYMHVREKGSKESGRRLRWGVRFASETSKKNRETVDIFGKK